MPACHDRGGNSASEVLVAARCWEEVLRNHAVCHIRAGKRPSEVLVAAGCWEELLPPSDIAPCPRRAAAA